MRQKMIIVEISIGKRLTLCANADLITPLVHLLKAQVIWAT